MTPLTITSRQTTGWEAIMLYGDGASAERSV